MTDTSVETEPAHRDASGSGPPGRVLAVVMAGVLISAIDTTIVVLALPQVEQSLHMTVTSAVWVVISYLLTTTLLATQAGRLGDMYGHVRLYRLGFATFTAGSVLCGAAWSGPALVAFRVLQGIGAACITANSGAIVSTAYPPQRRGKAYGWIAIGWSLGAVAGIAVGGVIVTYTSWRWVFLVNAPLGIAVLALSARVLRDTGERVRHRIDIAGMATLGLGLLGILWSITRAPSAPADPATLVCGIGGAVLLAAFVLVERAQREPMLRLSLLRTPMMAGSLLAALFQGLANYAVLFLVIMYLQGPRGLSPLHASLVMVPGYVLGGVLSPWGGRFADRYGPARPATAGLAAETVALLLYACLTPDSGLWLVLVAGALNGLGTGLFVPANNAAVMKCSPPDLLGISSGMLRTFASVGWVCSYSTALFIASRSIPHDLAVAVFIGTRPLHGPLASAFVTGLHSAFWALAGIMALAGVFSVARGVGGRPGAGSGSTGRPLRLRRGGRTGRGGADGGGQDLP